jgi:hypothetical protein
LHSSRSLLALQSVSFGFTLLYWPDYNNLLAIQVFFGALNPES